MAQMPHYIATVPPFMSRFVCSFERRSESVALRAAERATAETASSREPESLTAPLLLPKDL